MTAVQLSSQVTEYPAYSVVGQCTDQGAVTHVGLLEKTGPVAHGERVSVFHMANPRDRLEMPGEMDAHVLGCLQPLDDQEAELIQVWLEGIATSTTSVEYIAFPAADSLIDKVNGRQIGRRFSCAGFVTSCFSEAAGIDLVAATEKLPEVSVAVLGSIWTGALVSVARRYGLQGAGPWRVLLPSYLFHALKLARRELPLIPSLANPCFDLDEKVPS